MFRNNSFRLNLFRHNFRLNLCFWSCCLLLFRCNHSFKCSKLLRRKFLQLSFKRLLLIVGFLPFLCISKSSKHCFKTVARYRIIWSLLCFLKEFICYPRIEFSCVLIRNIVILQETFTGFDVIRINIVLVHGLAFLKKIRNTL